jgi:toxin YoeB
VAPPKKVFEVESTSRADLDFIYWQGSGNLKILTRINKLIEAARLNPATGLGKPERLKFHNVETYSRRIDRTHRLVYRVEGEKITILAARFHYADK